MTIVRSRQFGPGRVPRGSARSSNSWPADLKVGTTPVQRRADLEVSLAVARQLRIRTPDVNRPYRIRRRRTVLAHVRGGRQRDRRCKRWQWLDDDCIGYRCSNQIAIRDRAVPGERAWMRSRVRPSAENVGGLVDQRSFDDIASAIDGGKYLAALRIHPHGDFGARAEGRGLRA